MNEIEAKFYKHFGIEPKMLCDCEFKNLYDYSIEYGSDVCEYTESDIKNPCKQCVKAKQTHPLYPEITDRILLKLICIINNIKDVDELKNEVLEDYLEEPLKDADKLVNKVLSLFMNDTK